VAELRSGWSTAGDVSGGGPSSWGNLPVIHDQPRFVRGLARLRITPVFTATDTSRMKLIQPQFRVL